MKNINQIFKSRRDLMDLDPVIELIEYCQELESKILTEDINRRYDKSDILYSMLSDILKSCIEYEENILLAQRYPEIYKKEDANDLVSNLKHFIQDMNTKNKLGL